MKKDGNAADRSVDPALGELGEVVGQMVYWPDLDLKTGDVVGLTTKNINYQLKVVNEQRRLVEVTSDGTAIPGP